MEGAEGKEGTVPTCLVHAVPTASYAYPPPTGATAVPSAPDVVERREARRRLGGAGSART
eukprot:530617-Alexandrium_andersonii.AAC.1